VNEIIRGFPWPLHLLAAVHRFWGPLQTLENGTRLAVDAGKAGLVQTDPATSSEPQSRPRLPLLLIARPPNLESRVDNSNNAGTIRRHFSLERCPTPHLHFNRRQTAALRCQRWDGMAARPFRLSSTLNQKQGRTNKSGPCRLPSEPPSIRSMDLCHGMIWGRRRQSTPSSFTSRVDVTMSLCQPWVQVR
jgi:hypothetical protein